jgi:hypothetical protein
VSYSLTVPAEVMDSLNSLAAFPKDPSLAAVEQSCTGGIAAPSFGATTIAGQDGPLDFYEARQLGGTYGDSTAAAVNQVKGFCKAVRDLADMADRIRTAYDEANKDQAQALDDLTTALATGLGHINSDLGGPPMGVQA